MRELPLFSQNKLNDTPEIDAKRRSKMAKVEFDNYSFFGNVHGQLEEHTEKPEKNSKLLLKKPVKIFVTQEREIKLLN